jgi:hypothetical protein
MLPLACGPTPPEVIISLSRSMSAPPLDALARMALIVRACVDPMPAYSADLDITKNGSGQRPTFQLDTAILPASPFYVWIQGWSTCTATTTSCQPESVTHGDRCTCIDNRQQILSADGCSDWLVTDASTTTNVAIRLNAHQAGAKLCPPTDGSCPLKE